MIDGDIVRETLHNSLGFSRMDIKENNRLIASMAKKQMNYYDFILIPIISPYIDDRRVAKKIIGNKYFIELFIKSSLEKCIKRDVKGLYKKAIDGDITNMIGFSDSNPYEVPLSPNLTVNTGKINLHESVDIIIKYINKRQGN